MAMRPRVVQSVRAFQAKIACFLHYQFAHCENWRIGRSVIVQNLPVVGGGIVDKAFSELLRDHFLTYVEDEGGNAFYFLTESGIEWVEGWSDELYGESTEGVLFSLDGNVQENSLFPASDRTVTLNHNQPDYQETVAALDKVVEEFRNDHRLDNELGHEKGALLKALEGGRELLDDTVVNVRIGVALLVESLKRLVQKYDQALVGVLATAALEAVMKLFG